jgi:hypothetical protein
MVTFEMLASGANTHLVGIAREEPLAVSNGLTVSPNDQKTI